MSVSFGCTLLVGAASDLAPLEKPLARAFPACTLRWSFGSSGMLAQQIRHGADYDLYLSADEQYVEDLIKAGAAYPESRAVYATGRLALWSAKKMRFEDLPQGRNVAIANPQHAPYGRAAMQALESTGTFKRMGREKLVFGENVRQALRFAETGNADAALVAWSLVKEKSGQLLPIEWHRPILQTGVVPKRSRNPEMGRLLLTFLLSKDGQTLLGRFGFSPPPTPQTRPVSPGR